MKARVSFAKSTDADRYLPGLTRARVFLAVGSRSSGRDRLDARSGGAGRRNWRSAAARCRSNAQARSRPRFGLGWHARDKGKLLTGSGRSTASGAGSPTAGWHGVATANDGEQN